MHVITGGAGFIGSAFLAKLNAQGIDDILVVDELGSSQKWQNLRGKIFRDYVHKAQFLKLLKDDAFPSSISAIIHLGACSSTIETDLDFLLENNYKYSLALAEYAASHKVRLIYASSAATYGDGSSGYSEAIKLSRLKPLNRYGFSKHLFDLAMERRGFQPSVVGIKFFNVFGPNEYHKGEMRSVVHKAWQQIKASGSVRLFKSYRRDYADGEQKRDFIYIKDCCQVMWWLLQHPNIKGLFNLGSGVARSWNDLARAVFTALGKEPCIEYIEMPEAVRNQYQYFTQADMQKLSSTGCPFKFHSLEEGVYDYVVNYLEKDNQHL